MSSNPFSSDVLEDAPPDFSSAALLHETEFEFLALRLSELLDVSLESGGRGNLVLLKAPRAGYGKSYLLSRLGHEFQKSHCFLPVRLQREREPSWEELLAELLNNCDEARGPVSKISLLEELARNVFGGLTATLIRSGEIPSADPEKVIHGLESDSVGTFDFADPESEAVRWFSEVFESLLASYGKQAMVRYSISYEQALFWLRELCTFSRECPREGVNRKTLLRRFLDSDVPDWRGGSREVSFRAKCRTLLRMLSDGRPVVLLFDDLDEFFGEEQEVRKIALLVRDITDFSPGCLAILSVNQDLWESGFSSVLPGALQDRLSGTVVTMGGITREQAELLIEERFKQAAIPDDVKFRFQPLLDLDGFFGSGVAGAQRSPRDVIRFAKECWMRFESADYGYGEEGAATGSRPGLEDEGAGRGEKTLSSLADVEFISLSEPPSEDQAARKREQEGLAPVEGEAFSLADSQEEPIEPGATEAPIPEQESWPGMTLPDFDALFGGDVTQASDVAGEEKTEASTSPKTAEPVNEPEEKSILSDKEEESNDEVLPKLEPLVSAEETAPAVEEEESGGARQLPLFKGTQFEEATKPMGSFRKLIRMITGDDFREGDAEESDTSQEGGVGEEKPGAPSPRTLEQFAEILSEETRDDLPSYFNRLRGTAAESAGTEPLGLDRIGEVARAVGAVFPMIRQRELESPGRGGGKALRWVSGSDEIFLAFAPAEDEEFWAEILEMTAGRGAAAGQEPENGWEQGEMDVKMVALTPSWRESSVTAVEHLRKSAVGKGVSLDVIEIDPETAGALYAGAELFAEVESGALPHDPREVVNLIIQELDYFWRRITRPAAACEAQ